MNERLSNERLAELDRKVYWNAKALCDMAAVPNADLRALVDEVRERRAHECPEIPVHVKSREPRHTRPFK